MSTSSVVSVSEGALNKPNKKKVKQVCKEWFNEPLNVALFIWLCVVFINAVAFFLSLTGLLDNVLHNNKSLIDLSFEVPNQILNVLFALLCIYVHPTRFYHLFLLCRWRQEDVVILRKEYCKDGTYKPKERINMVIVVVLLHVNCFAQYALTGLNMGLRKPDRPVPVLVVCLVVSVAAPITAVILMNRGTLGRDYIEQQEPDIEAPNHVNGIEKRMIFVSRTEPKSVMEKPKWAGGLMDLCEDRCMATMSFFCCFCVFGWNLQRLGLGNMYVHIITFLLICVSPVGLFYLASHRIENEEFSKALQLVGVLLSFLSLLHGGIWRIKMRKEYNLQSNNSSCCASPSLTDCAKWQFCCWCSLAQEVRTGKYYDIVEQPVISSRKDDVNNNEISVEPAFASTQLERKDTSNSRLETSMNVPVVQVIQRGDTSKLKHGSPSSKSCKLGLQLQGV